MKRKRLKDFKNISEIDDAINFLTRNRVNELQNVMSHLKLDKIAKSRTSIDNALFLLQKGQKNTSLSHSGHKIKKRLLPNDKIYTPKALALYHIDLLYQYIKEENLTWYDPFRGKGVYFDNFPTNNKIYSEIDEKLDFFDCNERVDLICSNPAFSFLDKILQKSVDLNPKYISYLVGIHNFTPKRIEFMNESGYGLRILSMQKVKSWFGMTVIFVFVKGKKNFKGFHINRIKY